MGGLGNVGEAKRWKARASVTRGEWKGSTGLNCCNGHRLWVCCGSQCVGEMTVGVLLCECVCNVFN